MPTISLIRDQLFAHLGRKYTEEEFEDLCFEFGIELDEVTSDAEIIRREQGDDAAKGKSEEVIYKIELPANRHDLLCIEGLSRALRVFLGQEPTPAFMIAEPHHRSRHVMHVKPSTKAIRPYVVCAILRGITFDEAKYKSFIDLQDKLHQNICRQRTLVAIGTHDLDTIDGPFRYEALPPEQIHFAPLNDTQVYQARNLLDMYRNSPNYKHLKNYTNIIYDSPVYPVIYDSKNRVLSLPPIINGNHSKLTMNTRNVFIESTATDLTKANIVLDTIVTMFSQYCAAPFTIEPVDVIYEDEANQVVESTVTPKLSRRLEEVKVSEVNSLIGVQLDPSQICDLCTKMQLGPAEYLPENNTVRVVIPPTRSDILHPVDVIEDIAIAYGFNNVVDVMPPTPTIGAPLMINQFCDLLRDEIARAGYTEILTHGLCSIDENYKMLNRPEQPSVRLLNPANLEYQIVRTSLIPGALKTLQHNRAISMREGVTFFEISDVVLLDPTNDIGSRNVRRLVALYSGLTAGFEIIHGLVDRIMTCVRIAPTNAYAENSMKEFSSIPSIPNVKYFVRAGSNPTFFSGRCADVVLINEATQEEKVIGHFGIIHPQVLDHYELTFPASILEMDLAPLMI